MNHLLSQTLHLDGSTSKPADKFVYISESTQTVKFSLWTYVELSAQQCSASASFNRVCGLDPPLLGRVSLPCQVADWAAPCVFPGWAFRWVTLRVYPGWAFSWGDPSSLLQPLRCPQLGCFAWTRPWPALQGVSLVPGLRVRLVASVELLIRYVSLNACFIPIWRCLVPMRKDENQAYD